MTTPATFPSPGPSFAAGTAAGGTLILFGCALLSTANVAGGLISSQAFRIGRGKSRGGLPFFPKGPLSPVHNLKSIPSLFGADGRLCAKFKRGKKPMNRQSSCTKQPRTFGRSIRVSMALLLLRLNGRLLRLAFWIAPELKETGRAD